MKPLIESIPHFEDKIKCTGRLAIIKDPELKMRVIAMVDYLSQFVLKPIHLEILKILRNIPNDRTFTQNPFHN
jgi:hypothetical protein